MATAAKVGRGFGTTLGLLLGDDGDDGVVMMVMMVMMMVMMMVHISVAMMFVFVCV